MMNKKIISLISATILTICGSSVASTSAYYDYNGNYHNNRNYANKTFSNAHNYFYNNGGWGESYAKYPLYKNGTQVAQLICCYNPEMWGDESAQEWTGTYNGYTGFYMDGFVNDTYGSTYYSETRYATNWVRNARTDYMEIGNGCPVKFWGNIYW